MQLLFLERDQTLWRVEVDLRSEVPRIGAPLQLAAFPSTLVTMDLAPDGQRFLALVKDRAGLGTVTIGATCARRAPGPSAAVWLPNHPQLRRRCRRTSGAVQRTCISPTLLPRLARGVDRPACRAVLTVQPGGG